MSHIRYLNITTEGVHMCCAVLSPTGKHTPEKGLNCEAKQTLKGANKMSASNENEPAPAFEHPSFNTAKRAGFLEIQNKTGK